MNYELIKQLRDAGFPGSSNWFDDGKYFTQGADLVNPTLSELILACVKISPQGDFHLENLHNDWGAGTCFNPEEADEWYHGQTPEEAVAKLWLELNKSQ